jgi:hypothetical protein
MRGTWVKWALLGWMGSGAVFGFAQDNNARRSHGGKAAQASQHPRPARPLRAEPPHAKSEVRREVKETFRPKKHAKKVWNSKWPQGHRHWEPK